MDKIDLHPNGLPLLATLGSMLYATRDAPTKYRRRSRYTRIRPGRTYRKRYYKSRTKRTYSRTRPMKMKRNTLKRELMNLKKTVKSDQATHTHRSRNVTSVGGGVNQVSVQTVGAFRTTDIEAAVANLRYYNPATPGTLTTADGSSGTYSRELHFDYVYEKLTLRNNYQTPCKVKVWMCTPKSDTNYSPTDMFSNGVTDQTISIAVTSPLIYPSDIDYVTDNWKLKHVKSVLIQPGTEIDVSTSFPSFNYDPGQVDYHNLSYQSKYKAHTWLVRVEGALGHDTVATEYSTLSGRVDCLADRKVKITYDAGCNLNDYSETNNADTTFTTAGVVSNKAVADNQGYSKA